jgi:hypothetical protein
LESEVITKENFGGMDIADMLIAAGLAYNENDPVAGHT